jgi:hypothetical protein
MKNNLMKENIEELLLVLFKKEEIQIQMGLLWEV